MADQPQTADDVRAFVEERDIRFVRLWFTDILGQLKSFSINAQELGDAFEGGMGFDGTALDGGQLLGWGIAVVLIGILVGVVVHTAVGVFTWWWMAHAMRPKAAPAA